MTSPTRAQRLSYASVLTVTSTLVAAAFGIYWGGLGMAGLPVPGDAMLPWPLVAAVLTSLTLTASLALWRVSPWLAGGRGMRALAALVTVVAALLPFAVLALRAWRWLAMLPTPVLLLGLGVPVLVSLVVAPLMAALAPRS